jgi:hypothetical protein
MNTFTCKICALPYPLLSEGGKLGSGECLKCYTKRVTKDLFVSVDEHEDYQKTLNSLKYWEL